MADGDGDFLGRRGPRTFKGHPAPMTPEELRKLWHDECQGAKPLPVPAKELERQRAEAEKDGKVQ